MDTPDTIRAQQLKEIYQSISRQELNPTERLDVLLTLKQTVKVIINVYKPLWVMLGGYLCVE